MKVLDHGFVELVSRTGHMTTSVVDAARCSYGSESGDTEKDRTLVRYLLGNGHTSPFRHAFFTFHIKAPLFTFRQWWKYQVGSTWREYELREDVRVSRDEIIRLMNDLEQGRAYNVRQDLGRLLSAQSHREQDASDIQIDTDQGCSWNELSGRFKVMEPEFYVPDQARSNTGKQAANAFEDENLTKVLRGELQRHNEASVSRYEGLLRAGVAKELARLVLPPSIYSECFWTVSLQAVLHFLDQRLEPEAQYEIRQYAQAVLELIGPDLEAMGISQA